MVQNWKHKYLKLKIDYYKHLNCNSHNCFTIYMIRKSPLANTLNLWVETWRRRDVGVCRLTPRNSGLKHAVAAWWNAGWLVNLHSKIRENLLVGSPKLLVKIRCSQVVNCWLTRENIVQNTHETAGWHSEVTSPNMWEPRDWNEFSSRWPLRESCMSLWNWAYASQAADSWETWVKLFCIDTG